MSALVSVIMSTYNESENYIRSSINSILEQTLHEFRDALASLMRDDELRGKMARASRASLQMFSREAVGKQWVNLIEELCSDKEN